MDAKTGHNIKSGKLTVGDKNWSFPVYEGTIGPDVIDISKLYAESGMFTYDPGFTSTGSCKSKITYIDGDKGILLYRGMPIEQLAEHGDFLETCYLLLYGELPTATQKADFDYRVTRHTMVHEQMSRFFQGFRRDAHPMAVMTGCVGALSAFYHDSTDISDPHQRMVASIRMIAKMPTLAAMAYKYNIGQPFVYPKNELDYSTNFLRMCFAVPCEEFKANPVLARAMDRIFILHADHEQNASTSTVRLAGSTGANPFACVAAGIAALWGPGARRSQRSRAQDARRDRQARAHSRIHSPRQGQERFLPPHGLRSPGLQKLRSARENHAEDLPRGFERAWPSRRPAARRSRSNSSASRCTTNISSRRSSIRTSISIRASRSRRWVFQPRMFTVLFTLARTVGWIAQWKEMIEDPNQKIGRPRQLYTGLTRRDYVPISRRK